MTPTQAWLLLAIIAAHVLMSAWDTYHWWTQDEREKEKQRAICYQQRQQWLERVEANYPPSPTPSPTHWGAAHAPTGMPTPLPTPAIPPYTPEQQAALDRYWNNKQQRAAAAWQVKPAAAIGEGTGEGQALGSPDQRP